MDERQARYVERRRAWAVEIGHPIPVRRKAEKIKPEPGVLDVADETEG